MTNNKQILGITHREGEFNGRKYNNYIFDIGYQFSVENNVNEGIGCVFTDRVKMSNDKVLDFMVDCSFDEISDFFGVKVGEVFYNQYRRAVSFSLIDV